MTIARLSRAPKRQLGQFFTPAATAQEIVHGLQILPAHQILEPSFGEGAFVFAIVETMRRALPAKPLVSWCQDHLWGCELDRRAYANFSHRWQAVGLGPVSTTMEQGDFFTWMPSGVARQAATDRKRYFSSRLETFDLIIGNPPFGGSIKPDIQDKLDAIFGIRNGRKIKKETYAFFIVKSVDLLKPGGRLVFICSDTVLTIPTMTGLRAWLQDTCTVDISPVPGSFADTNQHMVLLCLTKRSGTNRHVSVFGSELAIDEIKATPNMSWRVNPELARYFTGLCVGDKMVASSGMTIGNNDLFLRRIVNGAVVEPYDFEFGERLVTVKNEIARARLGQVSAAKLRQVAEAEARGTTERVVVYHKRDRPRRIQLPHPDYRFYNKATPRIGYGDPEWVIFWRGEGDYVYTFKKTGNWYLRGVGGQKFFGREGLTWSLIAPRLYARYLPAGYVLDSGAPCAFLRPGESEDELYFLLGWALTDLCTRILKEVLNHTRNIQSKDFERLPYPAWVDAERKMAAIATVKALIAVAKAGHEPRFEDPQVAALNSFYEP